MTRFATRVLGTIRRYGLVGAGDRVAVAVSGGADSVALAFVLRELAGHEGFTVAGFVHLHHGLRGRHADADEEFCHALANRLGVAFDTERVEAATLARAGGVSLEHAGHDARYAYFARAARRLAANVVATGHTMDDQAETVLLRLVRGGRHDPLSGIHPRAGLVVRPLIDVRRADVERFLSERRLPWREDHTNADKAFLRNRIRHELLPLLRDRFAPGIVRTLALGAEMSRQDMEHLNRLATEAAPGVILAADGRQGRNVRLDRGGLATLPPALARRILRWALLDLGGRATSTHVAQLCHLLVSSRGGGLALGRVLVDVTPFELRLSLPPPPGGEPVKARWPWFGAGARAVRFALPIPGSVELPGADGVVTVEAVPSGGAAASHEGDDALVDGAVAGSSLFVRFRRAGDRLRPLGLSGHKKLQDLLVDRKVPRDERDRVPLVVSADDRIVWVAGQAVAADFAVSPATTGVLLLKFRRSGGKG